MKSIDLNSEEWKEVPRYRSTSPLGDPLPFDKQKCLEKLRNSTTLPSEWPAQWSAELDATGRAWSKQEARFWLDAIEQYAILLGPPKARVKQLLPESVARWTPGHGAIASKIADTLRTRSFEEPVTQAWFRYNAQKLVKDGCNPLAGLAEIVIPLCFLTSIEEVTAFLFEGVKFRSGKKFQPTEDWQLQQIYLEGLNVFRLHISSRIETNIRAQLGKQIKPQLDPDDWIYLGSSHMTPGAYWCAWALSMQDELKRLITAWPDDLYKDREDWIVYQKPNELIFEMADSEEMEHHTRRLKLRLRTTKDVRKWLAHTELSALDFVKDSVLEVKNKDTAKELAKELANISAPAVVPEMLDIQMKSHASDVARQWLTNNLAMAVPMLTDIAGTKGKAAESAREFLRAAAKKVAHEDMPEESWRRVQELVAQDAGLPVMDESNTPLWVSELFANTAKTKLKLPSWLVDVDLPAINVEGMALNGKQVTALLLAIKESKQEKIHPLITELREKVQRKSFDEFAWGLFERWLREGAPPKDKWAMMAVGLLGSDALAVRLAPLIKVWPGESQHQRAVFGLHCLRIMGTDVALTQISNLGQKLPFRALKLRARECIQSIAAERGMTQEQLEDRIVPDFGLDEKGTRVFDFGPRQFKFMLSPELKPMVRDSGGKVKTDLPKPLVKDDQAMAAEAIKEWKVIKAQMKDAPKIQAWRMEQAMISRRTWAPEEFDELLVNHAFMTNLVQRLVWFSKNENGRTLFRVTDDRSCATVEDRSYDLPAGARVGIVHPVTIPDGEVEKWEEIFSDYEIISPFPQLNRPVHRILPEEEKSKEIKRFESESIPAVVMTNVLDKANWSRGFPGDGGVFHEYSKPFPSAGVTAVITFEGITVGYAMGSFDQEIDQAYFLKGVHPAAYWREVTEDHKAALGDIDPIVISEVLSDLYTLAARSR